jgi:hypothetical protein
MEHLLQLLTATDDGTDQVLPEVTRGTMGKNVEKWGEEQSKHIRTYQNISKHIFRRFVLG